MERNTVLLSPETAQRIREYIKSVRWQFAKTYAKTAPHEYTVRQWNPDKQDEFENLVTVIRAHGYPGTFGKTTYIYFNFDGYKYWTMGAPVKETTVINREPLEGYQ